MRFAVALWLFLAQPFWDTKTPEQWTDGEIDTVLSASPWAIPIGPTPSLLAYFATALPVEDAERELRLRGRHPRPQPDPDYLDFIYQNRETAFVLAIPYTLPVRFGTAEDQRRMEGECEMLIGRKSYKIVGHFPPVAGDPVLRLIFPRAVKAGDKRVVFRLFVPGVPFPEREFDIRPKDLLYRGKLEM